MLSAAGQAGADEVGALLEALDAEQYEIRQAAAERIEELAEDPEYQTLLAAEFARLLRSPETSLEVRRRLLPLAARLPGGESGDSLHAAPREQGAAGVDTLLAQLEADSFATRVGAAARLEWLAERPELAVLLVSRIKQRLWQGAPSPELRKKLQPVWVAARRTWLASDPATWPPGNTLGADLEGWLNELSEPGGPAAPLERLQLRVAELPCTPAALAEVELLDLLVRDDMLPRVRQAVEQRLSAEGLNDELRSRLAELLEWTRPAMVAEYWEAKHHMGIQHLLIGVPNLSERASRPSLFDRIDEETAHCVSGNALTAGEDYPVGVLFPHPKQPKAQFHLVNLPTPRRRLAYEYYVKTDEKRRLSEVSRRTLDRLLAKASPLELEEVLMLGQLDARAASEFAGPYFMAVDDQPLPAGSSQGRTALVSRHTLLCQLLAVMGTAEAIAGIQQAIEAQRFVEPRAEAPYAWPWIAVLAIAKREAARPETARRLAALVERDDKLLAGDANPPEVGASAAAILLESAGAMPADFGLEKIVDAELANLGCPAYRFSTPDGPRRVLAWWSEKSHSAAVQRGGLR